MSKLETTKIAITSLFDEVETYPLVTAEIGSWRTMIDDGCDNPIDCYCKMHLSFHRQAKQWSIRITQGHYCEIALVNRVDRETAEYAAIGCLVTVEDGNLGLRITLKTEYMNPHFEESRWQH